MKEFKIMLSTIDDVKKFVNTVATYDFDVDLISGRYAVDAKSIMGIFSLDLSKAITMQVYDEESDSTKFLEAVKPYIVG